MTMSAEAGGHLVPSFQRRAVRSVTPQRSAISLIPIP